MRKTYSESITAAVPTVDVLKHIAASIKTETEHEIKVDAVSKIMEPERVSKAASDPTVDVLEQDLSYYVQELLYVISAANEASNSSDSDILMSLSKKLEQAADKLSEVSRKLLAAGESAGCPSAKELVDLMYPNKLQDQVSAMKLVQNRHDHITQVKAQSELDESRQNLATLIDNAYYASHNADGIPSVESMITKIDSSVTQMSQQLYSLASTDNDLAKQNSSLINEQAPHIIRRLRTQISCLQRREVTATLKKKKKAAKTQVESVSRDFIPDTSGVAKANSESATQDFIPDSTQLSIYTWIISFKSCTDT